MSKSKPKKPKMPGPSAQEKELARQGVEKWNRYQRRYAPLEEAELRNLDRSTVNLRAGRGNADLMQEVSQDAMKRLTTSNVASGLDNLGRMNTALSAAGASNAGSSVLGDRQQRDEAHLGAIQRGIGQAGVQQQGLSRLASQTNQQALDRYRIETRSDLEQANADNAALWGIAEAGMGIYAGNKMRNDQRNRLFKMTNPNGWTDAVATRGGRY